MAHFSWVRYNYKFSFNNDREELEVERGLFNDPEMHINAIIVPYIGPVLEKLTSKEGREEIREPFY